MTLSHRYKMLGPETKTLVAAQEDFDDNFIEEQKLQAFETGYQAGWDDAVKAQNEETARISAAFGQNLQDISFTYHEAVAKLTASFEPVMSEMVLKVLPAISRESLAVHIVDQVRQLVQTTIERPVEIVVSPVNEERVKKISEDVLLEPFRIVPDASLCDEQVFIRIGSKEIEIDLASTIQEVAKSADAFFHEIKERQKDE